MNSTLYVGNIPYSTTEQDLRELFGQAGTVREVRIVKDLETGKPRGFAFVEMTSHTEALAAAEQFHEKSLGGRTLTVNISRPTKPRSSENGSDNPRDRRPARDNRERAPRW